MFPHSASIITYNKKNQTHSQHFSIGLPLGTALLSFLFSVSVYFHQTYLDRESSHAVLINDWSPMLNCRSYSLALC